MPATFTFEEATKPAANTFSFEEANAAAPSAPKQPKTFTFEQAKTFSFEEAKIPPAPAVAGDSTFRPVGGGVGRAGAAAMADGSTSVPGSPPVAAPVAVPQGPGAAGGGVVVAPKDWHGEAAFNKTDLSPDWHGEALQHNPNTILANPSAPAIDAPVSPLQVPPVQTPAEQHMRQVDAQRAAQGLPAVSGSNTFADEYWREAQEFPASVRSGVVKGSESLNTAILPPESLQDVPMMPTAGEAKEAEARRDQPRADRTKWIEETYGKPKYETGQAVEGLYKGAVESLPVAAAMGTVGAAGRVGSAVSRGAVAAGVAPRIAAPLGGVVAAGVGAAEFGAATAVPEALNRGDPMAVAHGAAHPFVSLADLAVNQNVTPDNLINAAFFAIGAAKGHAELSRVRGEVRQMAERVIKASPEKAVEVRNMAAAQNTPAGREVVRAFDEAMGQPAAPEPTPGGAPGSSKLNIPVKEPPRAEVPAPAEPAPRPAGGGVAAVETPVRAAAGEVGGVPAGGGAPEVVEAAAAVAPPPYTADPVIGRPVAQPSSVQPTKETARATETQPEVTPPLPDGAKAALPKGLRPNAGWKLHLAVNPQNADAVEAALKGLTYKRGRSGGQVGKDFTVYVGSRKSANEIAERINKQVGHLIDPTGGDAAIDDVPISGNVMGRFDASGDPEFHQYGLKGTPHLTEDVANNIGKPFTPEQTVRADARLREKYGEFYAPPSAPKAAPAAPVAKSTTTQPETTSGKATAQTAKAETVPQAGQPSASVRPTASPAGNADQGLPAGERGVEPTITRAKGEESPPEITSQRRVDLERDRKKFGLPQLDSPGRRSHEALRERAMTEFTPETTDDMVSEIAFSKRPATDVEIAAMDVRQVELSNEYDDVMSRLEKAQNHATKASLEAQASRIAGQVDFLTAVSAATGTEQGRALAARRLSMDREMNLVQVLNRAKAVKGKELTAEEKVRFTADVTKLKQQNAEIIKQLRRSADARANAALRAQREPRIGRQPKKPEQSLATLLDKARKLLKAGCH